ncbi:MAG: HAD-IC family P-type ATPase, partial [Gammaproteobacteria bacterium]|nr:HAD-IC family P-type ATPase [Gammaproteobacteria bacterium]
SIWATATNVGHVYYDSIVMLVFLLLGARYFEVASRKRAFESVDRINSHVPPTANRWSDAGLESVPAVQLTAGDRVLIRPGETVPADGKVIDGYSTVDESLLTGESAPVTRCVGDQVVGGSINVETPLSVVVTALGDASVMATVQRLIDRAQSTKPTLVTVTDRLAVVFVTVVLVLAASAGIFWWYADSNRWLEITVAMLVVSCPCALSLATPTTFTAALLRLYRGGVLPVRNSALETLARADHIVFDKTGTLTAPEVHLHSLSATSGMSRDRLIRYAAALEVHSAHPIAVAIRRIAQGVELPTVTEPRATPGGGVSGIVDGRRIAIGTARYVGDQLGLGGDIVEPPHGVVLATETGVIGRFDLMVILAPTP